jgi:hypothetical protein
LDEHCPMTKEWRSVLQIFAVGLASLGFAVLVLFAGYFIGRSGGFYDAEANGYAAQYHSATEQRINDCLRQRRPPNTAARCVEEAANAGHEEQRAEQNLDAQRQMADWAWWLLVVTVVQTPITLVGILLLLRNIQQADAANEISRQAMMAENRAWVEIVPTFTLGGVKFTDDGQMFLNTSFSVRNIGKTVALNVGWHIALIPDPLVFPQHDGVAEFKRQLLTHSLSDTWPIFPLRELPMGDWEVGGIAEEMRIPRTGEHEAFLPAVCVGVRYNTIFDRDGDPPHITMEVSMLRRVIDGHPNGAFIGRVSLRTGQIALVRHLMNMTEVT